MEGREKINILMVDDRADGLLALEVAIRSPDYNLIKAQSGEEALRQLMDLQGDLAVILLDVQMPRMDGFETASLIKLQEKYRDVPIIFVTGIHGDTRFVTQGYEVGAIDYVLKPYQPYILRSKIAVLAELYRKTKLLQQMQEREQAAFRERERRLIGLVENSSDGISLSEPDGRLSYLNQAARDLVGIENDAAITDLNIWDFFEGAPTNLDSGRWEEELLVRHLETDRLIPVWVRCFTIADPESGKVSAIATVSRDITRLRASEQALRESEERFRTLTSHAPVGIFYANVRGEYLIVNQRWQALSGLEPERAIGRGWIEALHPDDKDEVVAAWTAAVLQGEPFSHSFRFKTSAGRISWVECRAVPLRHESNESVSGFLGSCADVTDRVRHESELREAAEELTKTNLELKRFAWVASHDMKEPLRMVSSYVALLQKRYSGKLDKSADDFIRFAVEGANRMYALVDGLLAFSGVSDGNYQSKRVDGNAVFDTVVTNLQILIEESGADIRRNELPTIAADPSQLGQLFQNLLTNAIKFRRADRPIVRVEAEEREGEWRFVVRDNGIGIDPKYRGKIFGIFQRLHTREEFPGTGVGLAICKKIVERHGGKIWVESAEGGGSAFCFTWPRLPAECEEEYVSDCAVRAPVQLSS